MSQRAVSLAIGLIGILLIVALAVLGIDIYRAAATGPHWRRRLLCGGIAVLSALGIISLEIPAGGRSGEQGQGEKEEHITCYMPARIPGNQTANSLSDRLDFLARLASEGKLQPNVIQNTLSSIELEIAELSEEKVLERMSEAERAKAKQVRDAAAEAVKKFKSSSSDAQSSGAEGDLNASADWKAVSDAWALAAPLAKSGRSTTAQREAVEAKLAVATESAHRLAAVGLLSNEEAELLAGEAQYILQDIRSNPPTDFKGTCYKVMVFLPAAQSLKRLAERLPLVEKLVAGGKVHQAALAATVARMRADLATLADPEALARLPEADRAKAHETAKQAGETLQKLERLLGPLVPCYESSRLPERGRPTRRGLDQRLAQIDALERQGKLQPAVAALLREGIQRDRV